MTLLQDRQPSVRDATAYLAGKRRRNSRLSRRLSIAGALILGASVSFAQPVPPTGIVENPCQSAAPAPASPEMAALFKMMMKPGPLDPQVMAKLRAPVAPADARAQEEQQQHDWPNLCRYRAENAALAGGPRPRAIFMGDSITEFWGMADPSLFSNGIIDRGISGQTSPQMLLRFYADVIALRPRVVHILAGTNDLAGNTGPTTVQDYKNNIRAMCDLAAVHGIKVILGSIPPAGAFPWRPGIKPAAQIIALNSWMRDYAAAHHLQFVDYHSALSASDGSMRADLTHDGIHPHSAGYALMRPLAEQAVMNALK